MESVFIAFWIILLVLYVQKTDSAIDDTISEAEEEIKKSKPRYLRSPAELLCPDLGVIKNGRIYYENPKRGISSMAFYECDANTDLFLNSTIVGYDEGFRQCQMDQQWSGPSDLQCEKRSTGNTAKNKCKLCRDIKCLKLVKTTDIFKHGKEIYSRPVSEMFEMFRDKDGYLQTDVIKHKQIDGQWEKPFPKCIGARCKIKKNLNITISYTNGSDTGLHVPSSSDVIVACKLNTSEHELKGFSRCKKEPDGTAKCTCNKGVLKVPSCEPKKCPNRDLPNILKSVATESDPSQRINYLDVSKHTSKAFLRCYDKHEVLDMDTNTYIDATDVTVTCDFGKWIPESDSLDCVPKRCFLKVNDNSKYLYIKDNTNVVITEERFVDNGMNISTECKDGYILTNTQGNTSDTIQTAQCSFGVWQNEFQCTAKPCDIPDVNNGRMLNLVDSQQYVKHNEQITIKCNTNYEIFNNRGNAGDEMTAMCNKGNWTEKKIICKPKRCFLKVNDNSKYRYIKDNTNVVITEERFVDNGMNISTECKDGYILTNTQGNTSDTIQTARCSFGVWQNEFQCTAKPCEIPDVNNGRMLSLADSQQLVKHNEQLTIKCDPYYEIFNNDGQAGDELITTCDKGNWNVKEIVCKPKRCSLKVNDNSKYSYTKDNTIVPITKERLIDHGMNISKECKDGYILINKRGNTSDTSQSARCNFGVWQNEYQCMPNAVEGSSSLTIIAVAVGVSVGVVIIAAILIIVVFKRTRTFKKYTANQQRETNIMLQNTQAELEAVKNALTSGQYDDIVDVVITSTYEEIVTSPYEETSTSPYEESGTGPYEETGTGPYEETDLSDTIEHHVYQELDTKSSSSSYPKVLSSAERICQQNAEDYLEPIKQGKPTTGYEN